MAGQQSAADMRGLSRFSFVLIFACVKRLADEKVGIAWW